MGLGITVMLVAGGAIAWADAPSLIQDETFSEDRIRNPGGLGMYFYVPESVRIGDQARPLVVLLHGCGQNAEFFFSSSGWQQLADREGFVILAPQQQKGPGSYPGSLFELAKQMMGLTPGTGNPFFCFSWFDNAQARLIAESVINMIVRVSNEYRIDPQRIYITGLSGGGAMTAAMLALYPQWFEAGATVAGVPFHCAEHSGRQAIADCMQPSTRDPARTSTEEGGKGYAPEKWGRWVRNESCPVGRRDSHEECPGPWPRTSIWQAGEDRLVAPGNQRDLMRQWTDVHGIDQVADAHETCDGAPYTITHDSYKDASGRVLVETWLIEGEGVGNGHGAPINPDDPVSACGIAEPFMNDANICSTRLIAEFFGLVPPGLDHRACRALPPDASARVER